MSKRTLAVVLAVVAVLSAAAATVLFGIRGWYNSAPPLMPLILPPPAPSEADTAAGDAFYTPAPVSLAQATAAWFIGKAPKQFDADKGALQRRRYEAGGLLTSFKDGQRNIMTFRYDKTGNLLKQ